MKNQMFDTKYKKINEELKDSISQLLVSNSIEFFIQNRIKTYSSYSKKIEKKSNLSNNEITDISGIRIIVNRTSELRRCINLLSESYKIDYYNSSFNPLSFIDTNEFGYASSHLIVLYEDIKTEIQIRTLSQHIWASTSHSLSYKSQIKDPLFERKLFRLSGLLEQIDVLLDDLFESNFNNEGFIYKDLKLLDYYSLEYFLSRQERIFSLISMCFEEKRTLSGSIKYPFSTSIIKSKTGVKDDMDIILIACNILNLKTPNELKQYLLDKKGSSQSIRNRFLALNHSSSSFSSTLRFFMFIIFEIPYEILSPRIEKMVHPEFLNLIKKYLESDYNSMNSYNSKSRKF